MISSDELLKPLSESAPCGEDLYYDPAFQELDGMIRGTPERQFGDKTFPAEEPDWKALHQRCVELFERSKDLRVAAALCLAALQRDGLPGAAQALATLAGMVRQYWEHVHPKLDPDDNNDPLQRINTIAALSTPFGTYGDPMKFIERLRSATLASSPRAGRITLTHVLKAQGTLATPEGETPVTQAQVDGAFQETPPEQLSVTSAAIDLCLKSVEDIDRFLTETVGSGSAPDLEALTSELTNMRKAVGAHTADGSAGAADMTQAGSGVEAASGGGGGGGSARAVSVPGEIRSRQDVVKALERICEYYKANEPSSPVPHLLKRALRLSEMGFMDIAKDLSPDALAQLRMIFGEQEGQS